jgi:hypothetical protein
MRGPDQLSGLERHRSADGRMGFERDWALAVFHAVHFYSYGCQLSLRHRPSLPVVLLARVVPKRYLEPQESLL